MLPIVFEAFKSPTVPPLLSRLSTLYFTSDGVTVPSRNSGKTNITMQAANAAQVYSGAFKQFFADALHQNDVIQQILQQTPITTAAAQQMGTFTINIPSAIIPVASALVANAINAYESSNKAAKKVAKEFSDKQQKERNHKENAEKEVSKIKQDNSNKENVR